MPTIRLDQLRIRQLRFLQLLDQQGSLSATAEQLAITPSAASMMLKEIEGLFDAKLFRRQGRGMVMTEHGRMLLPRCRTVLGEVSAMGFSLRADGRPLLRIGPFPHTTTTVLPGIIRQLTSATPAWRVQIVEGHADELLRRLLRGEIDLMLGQLPRQATAALDLGELEQRVLYESAPAVVAASTHPLARRRTVSLAELAPWSWVLAGPQSTMRAALADAFLRDGLVPPEPVVESPSFFYSLSVVANSELLTCCARSAALHSGFSTRILPVKLGAPTTPVVMAWRRNSEEALRAVKQLADAQPAM